MPVVVHEITMAAPNIVRVVVRDPPLTKLGIFPVASPPDPGTYQTIVDRTHPPSGLTKPARIIGAGNTHLKFMDEREIAFLDRTAAKTAAGYGAIGARNVTRVRLKSLGYDQGSTTVVGGSTTAETRYICMEHQLFLILTGNLAPGAYTITFPSGTGLPPTAFNFSNTSTRCSSIRVNQVGFRSKDQSKHASLSVWIPQEANEGDIDFMATYGLTTFKVLDASNNVKFTGTMTKRVGPADVEPNAGAIGTNIRYACTTVDPLVIVNITKAAVPVVTYSGTGFVPANGDIVMLRGIGGLTSPLGPLTLEGAYTTIQNVNTTAKTFEVASYKMVTSPTTGQTTAAYTGTFSATAFHASYGQLIYKTRVANRAATSVFDLDFTTANLLGGTYRVSIDGMGCSDPFRVDETVYLDLAKNSFKGYLNQCCGLALDGSIGGFVKPIDLKDGVNGHVCNWTNMPSFIASEWQASFYGAGVGSVFDSELAGRSPWITSNRATGIFGEVHDAGDWDCHAISHIPIAINLLTLGYEYLPSGVRNTSFGFPKSHTTLDSTLYAGTASLPDAVHQAIWILDFYRRLQDTSSGQIGSGSTASGRGYMRTSITTGLGGGGGTYEPSWLFSGTSFIHPADEAATYMYAGGAAALAKVLTGAGFTAAGTTWLNSALAAWTWAESIRNSTTTRDSWYKTTLGLMTTAGWSQGQYDTAMSTVAGVATTRRMEASGLMFRATDSATYGDIIKAQAGQGITGIVQGVFAYCNTPSADSAAKTAFQNTMKSTPGISDYSGYIEAAGLSYKQLQNKNSVGSLRTDNAVSGIYYLLYALLTDPTLKDRIAANFIEATNWWLGNNQTGKCLITGIGARWTQCFLSNDCTYAGYRPYPGVLVYAFDDYPWGSVVQYNFSLDLNYHAMVEYPSPTGGTDYGLARTVEPYRKSMPWHEAFFEHWGMIYCEEFQTHASTVPQQIVFMHLHAMTQGATRSMTLKWG